MIDDEKLIYEIRNLLDAPGDPSSERLAPLAEAYSGRCDAINLRLRECGQLLRQGLRSEALQRAQHDPGVLDQIVVLDFPERQQLIEACLNADVEPPPKLLGELASKLQAAGETERVLSVLMRKHRLLALARAPLSKRIATVRQIAQSDQDNAVWNRDLQKYEQARQQQIQVEAEQAFRGSDLDTLITLDQELNDPGWMQQPALALIDWVKRAAAQLYAVQAAALMKDLAPQLEAARQADDLDQARELATKWESCARSLGGRPLAPEIQQQAAAALAWVNTCETERRREEDYVHAVSELEQALNTGETRFDPLWRAIEIFGRPLPESLQERYRVQQRQQRRQRTRRATMLGAAAAVVLVVLGSVGYQGLSYVRRAQFVAEQSDALLSLIGQHRVVEARMFLDGLVQDDPTLSQEPLLRGLQVRIAGLIEQERQRREQVATAFAAIEQAASFEQPTFKSLSSAEQQVKLAAALELSEPDQQQLAALNERIAQSRTGVQKQINEQFLQEYATLADRSAKLMTAEQSGAEVNADSQKLLQEMRALRGRSGQVTSEYVTQLDGLVQQQDQLQKTLAARTDRQRALQRVSGALPDANAYRTALADYAKQYSGTTRAQHFTRVGTEIPLWQAIDKWNQLTERWSGVEISKLKTAAAVTLTTEAKQLLSDEIAAAFPAAAALRSRLAYLETVPQRESNNRTATRKLTSVLNDPTISGLRMIQITAAKGIPKRYYLLDPPTPLAGNEQFTIKAIVDFDLSQPRRNTVVTRNQVVALGETLDQPASQNALAKQCLELLGRELDTRGWDLAFVEMLDAIQQAGDVEPLVRLLLMNLAIEAGAKGSNLLAKALQPWQDTITGAEVDLKANWLNPDDTTAPIERRKASFVLDRLPRATELRTAVQVELTQLNESWLEPYRWIGYLLKDETPAANWSCVMRNDTLSTGELIVVYQPVEKGKIVIERIGKVQQGTATLDSANSALLTEGRAVFTLSAPSGKSPVKVVTSP